VGEQAFIRGSRAAASANVLLRERMAILIPRIGAGGSHAVRAAVADGRLPGA
jgi:hypothetical protein